MPTSPSSPTARAAYSVAPFSASAGVIFCSVAARVSASGRWKLGAVPGLKSVATATGTPASISARAGSGGVPRYSVAMGRLTATVPARASAAMPRLLTCSR